MNYEDSGRGEHGRFEHIEAAQFKNENLSQEGEGKVRGIGQRTNRGPREGSGKGFGCDAGAQPRARSAVNKERQKKNSLSVKGFGQKALALPPEGKKCSFLKKEASAKGKGYHSFRGGGD